jgi:hypothetical protein
MARKLRFQSAALHGNIGIPPELIDLVPEPEAE